MLFSGLTVAVAMAALVVFPQRFLYSIAVAGATVGILSAVIALFAVPALLALLGERINSLSVRRGPAVSDESDGWYRLAWWVMRRPVAVALASSALLLAAAAPLLYAILTGPSAEAVPPGQPSYEINEYVEDHYERDVSEGIIVTVRGDASPGELAQVRARSSAEVDGIATRGAVHRRLARRRLLVARARRTRRSPAPTQDAVREIRAAGGPAAPRCSSRATPPGSSTRSRA